MFPILGYGINETFFSGMTNLFAFSGLAYLYFVGPLLKEPKDFNKVGYMSIVISAFYLFLCIISLLFSFADIQTINEISPIYSLIRNTDFGTFLQRPDALFILGWILSLMSYISITVWTITNILQKITNAKNTNPMVYGVSALIFILALLPKNLAEIYFVQNTVFRYITIILVFIISFLILLFANIKNGGKKDERKI
jgi:spore germination protein